MNTKYILHGGYTRIENEQNKSFFKECSIDAKDESNVLIVLFASENDGDLEYYDDLCNRLKRYTEKKLYFKKANRENFVSQIEDADIIFFEGGDTNRILSILRRYENLSKKFIGKTIIGSSAGAYALATMGTSHGEIHMREGLGILPLRVVCHYESDELPPSDTSIEEIKNSHQELELVLLKDYEYRIFDYDDLKQKLIDIYAKKIWDYMHLHHEMKPMKPMDAIFILGSNELRVANRAAELYHQKLAPLIICSGGNGKGSRFELTEAEMFSQRLIELGVPEKDILLEPNATNTGENILNTKKLLEDKGVEIHSFILVQKPYMERRSYATFKKQWEGPEIIVTSPQLSYEEYYNGNYDFKHKFIEVMVGDLQRIKEYPKLGYQIKQDIPDEVLDAWQKLVDIGYRKYFLKD